jgi:hypothetical protein
VEQQVCSEERVVLLDRAVDFDIICYSQEITTQTPSCEVADDILLRTETGELPQSSSNINT